MDTTYRDLNICYKNIIILGKIFVLSMKIGNLYFQGKLKFYTFNDDAVFENEDQVLEKRVKSTKDGIRGRGYHLFIYNLHCREPNAF
jgi:hypothetical protein